MPNNVPTYADVRAPSDAPPRPATRGRRDAPVKGDYEFMAKRTRLAGSRGYTRPVKKPHRSLTTELATELTSPQCVSEVIGGATEITVPVVISDKVAPNVVALAASTHEVASDIVVPATAIHEVTPNIVAEAEVIPETISEVVPTTSGPDVVVAGLALVLFPHHRL